MERILDYQEQEFLSILQMLYQALKERGILVRHFETDRLKDYNRITIGSMEQMQELIEVLKELLK